eukprot:m.55508 g.55508  ORF g.55508 m.55508 type:complete len:437 (-) comp10987_c0_seq6:2020-3330(-)
MADYNPTKEEGRRRRSKHRESRANNDQQEKATEPASDVSVSRTPAQILADTSVLGEVMTDKLQLLKYDTRFCKEYNLAPIPTHYFVLPGSASEQLHYFANLVSWLLSLTGVNLPAPEQYADPNETTHNIMGCLKKLKAHDDVTQAEILPGSGESVCAILNTLAQNALKKEQWQWGRPVFPMEHFEDETMVDDAIEVKTMQAVDEDEIEDEVGDVDDEAFADVNLIHQTEVVMNANPVKEMLKADIDAATWRIEVERVLPQLKVVVRNSNKEWRSHIEQMQQYESTIKKSMTDAKVHLVNLHSEISKTLEKIDSREKYVNTQLDSLIKEFREHHDKLASFQEKYKQNGATVTELTMQLADLSDSLDTVKAQMDERGTSMTDSGPLVKIKQALTRLKTETEQMELRIGVVQNTLLSAKVNDNKVMVHNMNLNQPVETW